MIPIVNEAERNVRRGIPSGKRMRPIRLKRKLYETVCYVAIVDHNVGQRQENGRKVNFSIFGASVVYRYAYYNSFNWCQQVGIIFLLFFVIKKRNIKYI